MSAVVLVIGGCFWSAISGYGGAGHDHNHDHDHDHGAENPASAEVAKPAADFVLTEDSKSKLDLEVGSAELREFAGSKKSAIAVPAGAILKSEESDEKATVYLTEDSGEKGEAQNFVATEIKIGAVDGDYVEVLAGLFPGDTVIVKNVGLIPASGSEVPKAVVSDASPQSEPQKKVADSRVASAEKGSAEAKSAEVSKRPRRGSACDSTCPKFSPAPRSDCPFGNNPAPGYHGGAVHHGGVPHRAHGGYGAHHGHGYGGGYCPSGHAW